MGYMPVTDSMFLLAESREHPMHVGGLQLFTPPEDAGPEFITDVLDTLRSQTNVSARFRRRPADPVNLLGTTWWTEDEDIDFEYHVRHSAVPRPGRIRELFQLTSRWHSALLDRHRPMWEMHVVEGLQDGRFATYTKVHHSVVDGVSALRLLQNSLSTDPDDHTCTAPWSPTLRRGKPSVDTRVSLGRLLPEVLDTVGSIAGLLPAGVKIANQAFRDNNLITPLDAPDTLLNQPIGGSRRFVAQSWEIERVRDIGRKAGATLNDVVLAMCAGALRTYLLEQDALPDKSLTTAVPVSLRSSDNLDDGGNSVGLIIATLATDVDDPAERLATIRASVQAAKAVMGELSPLQILAMSAMNGAPLALTPLPGFVSHTRPPFNVLISNVPGPKEQMYWNGARLDGVYPASIPMDGMALNITLTSNYDKLDFGLTGCRRTLPSLQRMIHHLEDALLDLEKAVS
ncbi:WS/DGAT/MGAT family O-acyltransferase [Jongsikchunia kroppenstedtii]|uniref:WS/DGAT/MGAT family O-acyltransferase n=1 Tax=Jongsikchunia kroppenstedtii TaxID=1121721 RepID=UPI000360E833|nr:wax ester/triacylglycerol synthase family O-acyltransferase [Jongsikchunia kroppenstedtii]